MLQSFEELACLEVAFQKTRIIWILVCNLQTRPDMLFFLFSASIWVPTCGIIFIVIPIEVFKISGVVSTPPDAIKLSEKADAINREVAQ